MSATKMSPLAFALVRSAIVALATWNTMLSVNLSLAPPPHVVHWMPNTNEPVPSMLKEPVATARVWPVTVWSTVVSPTTKARGVELERHVVCGACLYEGVRAG
jgi:hypothetical protein